MNTISKVVGTIAVSMVGLSASTDVPFQNVESWMKSSQYRSSGAVTALEKAALIHAIDRRDMKEGTAQRSLGRANFTETNRILENLDFRNGRAIDTVIKADEVHFYHYSTDDAASVKATLAWLEEAQGNLNVRILRNGAFVRPWSQSEAGIINRKTDDTRSTVERVDTEIKKAEDFVIQISMNKKEDKSVPYALLVSGGSYSQRQRNLEPHLNATLNREAAAKARVDEYLKSTGAAKDTTLEDGSFRSIIDIRNGKPVYYQTTNFNAVKSSSSQKLWPGGELGLNINGSGLPRSIGIWDGGAVLETHVEFGGRVTSGDNSGTTHEHATHVAGTMIASGVDSKAQGMAEEATLISYEWTNDESEMKKEAAKGLAISQHSYGIPGDYTYSNAWDILAYDYPFYTVSKSAANDGSKGAGTVTLNGNAKNIITVGSAHDQPNGWINPNTQISSFSSRGPAPDKRIKPDIMANGQDVWSPDDKGDNSYQNMSGTSMSGPAHAGSVALLHEHYYSTHGQTIMRSATMKALVIHTADEMGDEGPDYNSGWGYLNTATAAQLITDNDGGDMELIQELSLSNGDEFSLDVVHINNEPITVTVVWNDPAPSSSQSQGSTPKLVNDLDLRVNIDGTEYLPWAMNTSTSTAVRKDNTLDNVEKIQIDASVGKNVTITVSHKGSLDAPQDFSLILSGVETDPTPYVKVSTPNGGEKFEQYKKAMIKWRSNVDEPVDIILFKGGALVDTLAKSAPNSGVYEWDVPEDMEVGDDYSITVTCITTTDLTDESDEKFSIVPEYLISEFPWKEPFEEYEMGSTDAGKWVQESETDEIDWLIYSGVTPTGEFATKEGKDPGTGPMGDHTSGNGNYIYMEATGNWEDNKTCLISSPNINLLALASPKLSYWLHMNSVNNKMGTLDLNIVVDGEVHEKVKTYSGNKGLEWFQDSLDLSNYKGKRVQLQFHGTVGDSFYSDICIDDIEIDGEAMPYFKDLEALTGKEGVELSKKFTIGNPAGDMSFSIKSGQTWLSAEKSGSDKLLIEGTPEEGDAGKEMVIIALNAGSETVTDSFEIDIVANRKPTFTSADSSTKLSNENIEIVVTLSDEDSENDLSIEASDLPDWLSFDDNGDGEGALSGKAEHADTGIYKIKLKGDDGVVKEKVEQIYTLKINKGEGILDGVTLIEENIVALPANITVDNSKIEIALGRTEPLDITLYIFDKLGNVISKKKGTIRPNYPHEGLGYCGEWDGTNKKGQPVASGTYSAIVKVKEISGNACWYRTYIGIQR